MMLNLLVFAALAAITNGHLQDPVASRTCATITVAHTLTLDHICVDALMFPCESHVIANVSYGTHHLFDVDIDDDYETNRQCFKLPPEADTHCTMCVSFRPDNLHIDLDYAMLEPTVEVFNCQGRFIPKTGFHITKKLAPIKLGTNCAVFNTCRQCAASEHCGWDMNVQNCVPSKPDNRTLPMCPQYETPDGAIHNGTTIENFLLTKKTCDVKSVLIAALVIGIFVFAGCVVYKRRKKSQMYNALPDDREEDMMADGDHVALLDSDTITHQRL